MEGWFWECRLTAFLPELTLLILLFVIFQNVLANTAFNNQGIIFILQIYADQKTFNCEMFIKMSVWEHGKHALGGRESERAGSRKALPLRAALASGLFTCLFSNFYNFSFLGKFEYVSLSSERNREVEGGLELNRSF